MTFEKPQEKINAELIDKTDAFCDIITWFRKYKSEKKMSMKDEIAKAAVRHPQIEFFKENLMDFTYTLSIKELELKKGEKLAVVKE